VVQFLSAVFHFPEARGLKEKYGQSWDSLDKLQLEFFTPLSWQLGRKAMIKVVKGI